MWYPFCLSVCLFLMLFCHVVITVCACTFVTCTLIKINQSLTQPRRSLPWQRLQQRQQPRWSTWSSWWCKDDGLCQSDDVRMARVNVSVISAGCFPLLYRRSLATYVVSRVAPSAPAARQTACHRREVLTVWLCVLRQTYRGSSRDCPQL